MTAREDLIAHVAASDYLPSGEAEALVDDAINEALHAAAEKQRTAIAGFDLDDHWATMYRAEDVETLPDLIDPSRRLS